MQHQRALTLVESLAALAIVAVLIGLLLPAIQASRKAAREAVCKNNLRQINLAVAGYAEAHSSIPARNKPGVVGGWTIEILPFVGLASLEERVDYGIKVDRAQDFLLDPPAVYRCPMRAAFQQADSAGMQPGHYVLQTDQQRGWYSLYDAPISLAIGWASGPEVAPGIEQFVGPHRGGFFCANGFQRGVEYSPGRQSD